VVKSLFESPGLSLSGESRVKTGMTPRTVPIPRRIEDTPAPAVVTQVRRLAFWGSVLLPVVYLPLLSGVAGDRSLLVAGLLALNAVCLLAGHGYSPQ
jgi:hypothetical protein